MSMGRPTGLEARDGGGERGRPGLREGATAHTISFQNFMLVFAA